jgi:hypothetical protein
MAINITHTMAPKNTIIKGSMVAEISSICAQFLGCTAL